MLTSKTIMSPKASFVSSCYFETKLALFSP